MYVSTSGAQEDDFNPQRMLCDCGACHQKGIMVSKSTRTRHRRMFKQMLPPTVIPEEAVLVPLVGSRSESADDDGDDTYDANEEHDEDLDMDGNVIDPDVVHDDDDDAAIYPAVLPDDDPLRISLLADLAKKMEVLEKVCSNCTHTNMSKKCQNDVPNMFLPCFACFRDSILTA